ncbi:hypothetical protein MSG28_015510 [Choristoneura fumiferana]|uniref:Uncharacterized protein n=1 Tax=Choristoneura fumiferana TaxID=7141 RepID=A0ACC0KB96_CHOFU|nr:hypothetical protein MSG28_015510 [Choristoneura fumiferana]
MPVVSPYINSSTTLSGSYRSTLTSSSSLDKPYFRSSSSGTYVSSTLRNSYGTRTSEYSSRFNDVDGKRERKSSLVEYSRTRAPSVTDSDSGISTRYRSERSESRGRDVSTTRSESSKERPKRIPSSAAMAMSTAELYNKYSPANYVPYTQRVQQQQNEIARSKSISNDIGRPPAADGSRLRKPRNAAATIAERPEGRRSYKETSPTTSYSKRNSMTNGTKDSNGNEVPSVSEIRKRFDSKMTVTKLPANDTRYSKTADHYYNQLKEVENGYSKVLSKDEKPVPVHLPYAEKNGYSHRWDSSSSRSNSNSDLSLSKTISEPTSLAKPVIERNGMSTSLTTKLPTDRLASIKSQLDPNNPIGKILEKSTVIQVENGDGDHERKKRSSPEVKPKLKEIKNDIEKQVKAPKHTSNFASYIQISQPIASGSTPKKEEEDTRKKVNLKYIDSEEDRLVLDNDIESPSGTGFENKTFEHENFLKKRSENLDSEIEDGVKSMETSTESTVSEPTEDSSPDTPSARRKILDDKDIEDIKAVVGPCARSARIATRYSCREAAVLALLESKTAGEITGT